MMNCGFEACVLFQEMSFFDMPKNSVGALCAQLSTEATYVKNVSVLWTIKCLIHSELILINCAQPKGKYVFCTAPYQGRIQTSGEGGGRD